MTRRGPRARRPQRRLPGGGGPLPLLLAAAAALLAPRSAAGQSLFSARGLGVPVAPLDARARVLGGIGVGLLGWNPSLVNPAEGADAARRSVVAAIQPSRRSVEFQGDSDDIGATRFPLIRVAYPMGRMVVGVGYGGFLDQGWAVVQQGHEVLDDDSVRTEDRVESTGGIAQAQLTMALRVLSSLTAGAAVGVYTGRLERTVERRFPDDPSLQRFETRVAWNYFGPLAAFGLVWDAGGLARVGASVTWSGTLEAEGDEGEAADRRFDLPLQVAAGASAWLSPRLLLALSGRWAGWSSAAAAFEETGADDTWELGGGLEWGGAQTGERSFPLRVGFHYGRLPFRLQGATPTEWSVALGTGMRAGSEDAGRAALDVALERGSRGDRATTGLTEDFWRLTISLSLFGR